MSYFFLNNTATTEIYTLSLHDALPICRPGLPCRADRRTPAPSARPVPPPARGRRPSRATSPPSLPRSTARPTDPARSEEHTSELQSRQYLVCRLLLEKKKTTSVSTILS